MRVVLHPHHPRGVAEAFGADPSVDLVEPDVAAVASELISAGVLVSYLWDDAFLTPSLRWVQSVSAGVEQFPQDILRAAGVALSSARGVHAPQVAEHAFALLLALTRGVGVATRDAERRVWRPRMADELTGRTFAILGLGSIGEEIARRAAAWGVEVIGVKANPDRYSGVARRVVGPGGFLDACSEADVLMCCLPSTAATMGMVDGEALAALGRGWLINVGRGDTVDEQAVLSALDDGELRGAGLDVFSTEPLPAASRLWDHPRVVLTPHTAGFSPKYGERLLGVFHSNLSGFLGHGEWATRVV